VVLPRIALLALAVPLAGCSPRTWTEVKLRDPSAAAVEIETPHGPEVLLPAGRVAQEITLPRTTPPYGREVLYESSALREEGGAITMRCDACIKAPIVRLVPAGDGATLSTDGLPNAGSVGVAFERDALRMRLAYPYYVPAGRSMHGPYVAFRYDVVVPRDAVMEVREKREDLNGPGWVVLAVGAALTAGSIALIDLGAQGVHARSAAPESVLGLAGGILLLMPAAILDLLGIGMVTAPGGYDRRVEPP
jgi:hypothetical protein